MVVISSRRVHHTGCSAERDITAFELDCTRKKLEKKLFWAKIKKYKRSNKKKMAEKRRQRFFSK